MPIYLRCHHLFIVCLLFFCVPGYAEIYKWVDENGRVHFSEKITEGQKSEELSDKLEGQGNFLKFEEVPASALHQSSEPSAPKKIKVKVQIDLIEYEMSEDDLKLMRKQVNAIYAAYVRWFDWSPVPAQPIKIKVFGKYATFERYQIESHGRFATHRSHYSPKHKEILMHGTEFAETTLGLLFHEVSHAILDMEMRLPSKWMNEGLAEVFQSSSYSGGKIKLEKNMKWTETMQHKLREGSLQSMKNYLTVSNSSWSGESSRVENQYYMIAWSLMRFLLSTEQRTEVLRDVINISRPNGFYQGKWLAEALDSRYPGGTKAFDAHWRQWLREL